MSYIHLTTEDHRRLFAAIVAVNPGFSVEGKREVFFSVCEEPTSEKWSPVRDRVLEDHGEEYASALWTRLKDRTPATLPKR